MRIITSVAPLYCIPDLEMKTPRISIQILFLCHLTLSLGRELREGDYYDQYNYEENNGEWSNDYNYTYWAHQEPTLEQRGQAFWRAECRAWNSEEIYLEGDKERSFSYPAISSIYSLIFILAGVRLGV